MKELKGCKKKDKRTLKSKLTNLRPAKLKADIRASLPKRCTLRDKFPPVYTQKHGDCTTNAVLGCDDYLRHGTGLWIPSATFTYFNQKKNEVPMIDNGTSIEKALNTAKKYGICDSKIWSNDEPWNLKPSDEAYANGKNRKLKKWYEVKNLKQLRKALVSGYPVVSALDWAFKYYDEHYVLNEPTNKDIDASNGHAIVVVGYDDLSELIEIRNSWSALWADSGYGYIRYSTFKRLAWWEDTYAVTG